MRAVNLIPTDQRSGGSVGAGRSGGAAYAVLALMAGFAVLAIAYGKASRTVSSDQSKAASLTAQAQQDKTAAEALAPYTTFVALRHQREAAVTELVDTRFDWAHAFHELGRVLSNQTSIAALSGQIGATQAASTTTAATPAAPRRLFLLGRARFRLGVDGEHGHLRDTRGERADVHAQRLRHQPDRRRADDPAAAPDGRRPGSDAPELHQVEQRLGRLERRRLPGERPGLQRDDHLRTAAQRHRSRFGRRCEDRRGHDGQHRPCHAECRR